MAYQGVAELRHSRELKLAKQQGRAQSYGIGILLGFYLSEAAMRFKPKAASPTSRPDATDVSGATQCWSAIQLGKVLASVSMQRATIHCLRCPEYSETANEVRRLRRWWHYGSSTCTSRKPGRASRADRAGEIFPKAVKDAFTDQGVAGDVRNRLC